MDISTISRILSPLVGLISGFLKKPLAEHTAVLGPAAAFSSIGELDKETFVHLGVSSFAEAGWQRVFQIFLRSLVLAEPFSLPHVHEWLDLADTQRRLQHLAHARIACAAQPSGDRVALVESYMRVSGEHPSYAENIIDHAVEVLVAGVLGAAKDRALVGVLQVNMHALQKCFDDVKMRLDAQALPELGWSLDIAYKANTEWLLNAFSSRSKAKTRFGQPLSPADTTGFVNPMSRTELTERFEALFTELPIGGVVALTGDEGNGKSWLVAQAWLSRPVKPLTLFLSAEDVSEQIADPVTLMARHLCVQTDRQGFERHQAFWSVQLGAWRAQRQGPAQGFWVVLDGLNQRPRVEWARLIDRFSAELECIGGKLILTSRKRYFDEIVKSRLVSPCRELAVPEWTPSERDALLTARGMHTGLLRGVVA